ncbi:MAG TPA: hypothetical protein VEV39_04175 [Gemmatimonadales bacterium]|nr:hypothetical protein [Gemmatimonadales bacterium]
MKLRIALCLLFVAGCRNSTEPDQVLTGNWSGTFSTTSPPGPSEAWTATLTQSGSALSGSFDCASTEPYTVTGTNVHNAVKLTLIGGFGDTATFNGSASNNGGVLATGTFFDKSDAVCLSGSGIWQGRIQ